MLFESLLKLIFVLTKILGVKDALALVSLQGFATADFNVLAVFGGGTIRHGEDLATEKKKADFPLVQRSAGSVYRLPFTLGIGLSHRLSETVLLT
jgi:hypothetical protein